MNLSQLPNLFSSDHAREYIVLKAVCQAVTKHQEDRDYHHLELIDEMNGVSLDAIVEQVPFVHEGQHYGLVQVIRSVRELHRDGWISDTNHDFEVICLTDKLVLALGEEVAAA